ncbi:MAG: hypothetical protein EBS24_04330 [Chitinophagia bacterium]|nr:hypothetical protein [Chitinophagia bacterium]
MKNSQLKVLLLISTFIGYLEWGTDQSSFIVQSEWEVLKKLPEDPLSLLHPFILLPVAGQLLLLFDIIKKNKGKKLSVIAIVLMSLLYLMILFIGLLDMNFKKILSALPFFILSFVIIRSKNTKTSTDT